MTGDEYLKHIVRTKKSDSIALSDTRVTPIVRIIRNWSGDQLADIYKSGSSAKGTAIRGVADLDIFISLKASTTNTLSELYHSLGETLERNGINTRLQNVSIGIRQKGLDIDLVPARRHTGLQNWHSLYSKKKDSWLQTNVKNHINLVIKYNRINEIILTKVWRELNDVNFPSIYLELIVIEALKYYSTASLADNLMTVLNYLENKIAVTRIIDPSNSNNIISDSITYADKLLICVKAKTSRSQHNWERIVW